MTVAIIGAGVMGETLLSGLIRAGRRADRPASSGEKRPSAPPSCARSTASRSSTNVRGRRTPTPSCWWSSRRTWATCSPRSRPHVRPGQLVVSLAAGITTDYIEAAPPRGRRRSSGSCRTRRRSSTRGWPRSRAGTHCDEEHLAAAEAAARRHRPGVRVPEKQQDAVTAISGSGPGVPLLRRRGDDRGRRPPRAAAHDGHRAGRADDGRLGQAAARDRRAPDRAARAGHLAGRHDGRGDPRSSRTTRCGPRSSPRWRPPATAPGRSPRPMSDTPAEPARSLGRPAAAPAWSTTSR